MHIRAEIAVEEIPRKAYSKHFAEHREVESGETFQVSWQRKDKWITSQRPRGKNKVPAKTVKRNFKLLSVEGPVGLLKYAEQTGTKR